MRGPWAWTSSNKRSGARRRAAGGSNTSCGSASSALGGSIHTLCRESHPTKLTHSMPSSETLATSAGHHSFFCRAHMFVTQALGRRVHTWDGAVCASRVLAENFGKFCNIFSTSFRKAPLRCLRRLRRRFYFFIVRPQPRFRPLVSRSFQTRNVEERRATDGPHAEQAAEAPRLTSAFSAPWLPEPVDQKEPAPCCHAPGRG